MKKLPSVAKRSRGPKKARKMVLKRIMDYRSRVEKWLGEYDNQYFWKFVVVMICKCPTTYQVLFILVSMHCQPLFVNVKSDILHFLLV